MSQNLIVVDITEEEIAYLDSSSNLKEVVGKGKLIIKNPTQKSRLWDLDCDLKEIVKTTFDSRALNIGVLNPAQEIVREYELKGIKAPTLEVKEEFDTDISDREIINNTFLFQQDNKCLLKIKLENPQNLPILEIKVYREIPDIFHEIEIKSPTKGDTKITEENGKKKLTWEITSLNGREKVELEIYMTSTMNLLTDQTLGSMKITYLVNNYHLSMISPEVRGLTDSMSGVETEEGTTPGVWNCNVEFINDSEFQVRVEDVRVSHKIVTGSETVVSQTPDKILNPGGGWEFNFQVESKNVPELTSEIGFTPLYLVISRVVGEIIKESSVYSVLSATIKKDIRPEEVDAYAVTDLIVLNTIFNNGSSPIEKAIIFDEIPKDFVPSSIGEIRIRIDDFVISERKKYIQNIIIEPNDQDVTKRHQISIGLHDLSSEFTHGKTMVVSYPLQAKNPRPPTETVYKTPIKLKVNSSIEGNFLEVLPEEEPEIKIKYVKRKLKTLKSIKPGFNEGEFNIAIRLENKGGVALENVIVKEKIPLGFALTEFIPPEGTTHQIIQVADGTELQIKFIVIKMETTIILNYNCIGEGSYPRSEPNVIVLGREALESIEDSSRSQTDILETKPHLDPSQQGLISEVFIELYKKVNQTVSGEELGQFLEDKRDYFPPGPITHQILSFARELKNLGDKLIIGTVRDDILTKLRNFETKYE
ncbi:MAG: hypothetical protein ACW96S_04425 [Promethearchaeota archaeon]|jgi:hypothetical protein